MEVTSRKMMHETTFYTSTLALLGSGAVLPVCVIQEATWHCIACDYCSIITGALYNCNKFTYCMYTRVFIGVYMYRIHAT